jgi:hypothetical protein
MFRFLSPYRIELRKIVREILDEESISRLDFSQITTGRVLTFLCLGVTLKRDNPIALTPVLLRRLRAARIQPGEGGVSWYWQGKADGQDQAWSLVMTEVCEWRQHPHFESELLAESADDLEGNGKNVV